MHTPEALLLSTARGDWVRVRTLVALRWLAIGGQLAAVLVARLVLHLDIRLDLCLLAIGASVAFNLTASIVHPPNKRLNEPSLALTLLFDVVQLFTLLFLTGGLSNPFSLLMLVPVTIGATALTLASTVAVSAVAVGLISLLVWRSLPLMTQDGVIIALPPLFIAGAWVSLVIGIVFLAGYARRVTDETFSMSLALGATQMALAREQRLTALGGVVAAAAHEMGTPLATIKLVTAELEEELTSRPELLGDIRLVQEQTDRCRDILRDMGRAGRDDALVRTAPLSEVIAEAAEPHLDRGKQVLVEAESAAPPPEITRRAEMVHGLRNLIQNAVDFAATTVWIDTRWADDAITVVISDDGPGFPSDLIGRLGDPYIRRRALRRHRDGARAEYEGMGLGLFIAKTLLERTGAELTFAGVSDADGGAMVTVRWPRAALEAHRSETRGPLGRNELNLP